MDSVELTWPLGMKVREYYGRGHSSNVLYHVCGHVEGTRVVVKRLLRNLIGG